MNKPTRHISKNGLDPTKCVASIHDDNRWPGFHQCSRKRKPGTEWCGIHTYVEATEDSPKLWCVGTTHSGEIEIVSIAIVKETAKQITLDKTDAAFEYKSKVGKDKNGEPLMGSRTKYAAINSYRNKCFNKLVAVRNAVQRAEATLAKAENLLTEANKEEAGEWATRGTRRSLNSKRYCNDYDCDYLCDG